MTDHHITHRPDQSERRSRRRARAGAVAFVAAVACAATAGSAPADPGSPGSTFPEQPGAAVAGGCAAILSTPNNAFYNRAAPAAAIVEGLTIDACFGG